MNLLDKPADGYFFFPITHVVHAIQTKFPFGLPGGVL